MAVTDVILTMPEKMCWTWIARIIIYNAGTTNGTRTSAVVTHVISV